jgi:general nucleoside transport system permease protein
MMLAGAVTGFIAASTTHSICVGIGAGMLAGAVLATAFAVVAVSLLANQVEFSPR